MYYLIIDTCVWLETGKDVSETSIIDKLTDFVNRGQVCLIVPSIIREEWNKHKIEKIIKENEQSISGKLKNVKDLLSFLDSEKANVIEDIISFESEIKEDLKQKSHETIDKIEYLFNHRSTRNILINDRVKLKAIQWGLDKKAPFHRKSSVADALIILSALDYITSHNLHPSIFITNNIIDFSSKENKKNVHEDLAEDLKHANLKYYINIGEVLNKIETNAISEGVVNKIEKQSQEMKCYKCGMPMNNGSWRPSQYGGLTWQYQCCSCGFRLDTGEFWD